MKKKGKGELGSREKKKIQTQRGREKSKKKKCFLQKVGSIDHRRCRKSK